MHRIILLFVMIITSSCALKQNRSEISALKVIDHYQHYQCQKSFDSISNPTYLQMWFDKHHKLVSFKTNYPTLRKIKVADDIMEEGGSSNIEDEELELEKEDFELKTLVPPNEVNINLNDTYVVEKLFSNDIENQPIILHYRIPTFGTDCDQTKVIKLDNWRNQFQAKRSAILLMEGCIESNEVAYIDGEEQNISVSKAQKTYFSCLVSKSDSFPKAPESSLSSKNFQELDARTIRSTVNESLKGKESKFPEGFNESVVTHFKKSQKTIASQWLYESEDFVQVLRQYKFDLSAAYDDHDSFFLNDKNIGDYPKKDSTKMICNIRYRKSGNDEKYYLQPEFTDCHLEL